MSSFAGTIPYFWLVPVPRGIPIRSAPLTITGNTGWVLDSANLLHMAGLLIPPIVPPSRSDFSFAPTTPTFA